MEGVPALTLSDAIIQVLHPNAGDSMRTQKTPKQSHELFGDIDCMPSNMNRIRS